LNNVFIIQMVNIKNKQEIEVMREGCKKTAQIVEELGKNVKPGVNTLEIDEFAEKLILNMGGTPAFKGYGKESGYPFPATICASINNEVVHGIPKKDRILQEGDIFKIDTGMIYNGMFTDMTRAFAVGKISDEKKKIISVAKGAFYAGLEKIRPDGFLSDYSKAVQKYVEKNGFSVVRDLTSHGIGKNLHESPQILNFYHKGYQNLRLQAGMTFALEPIINAGSPEIITGKDGWTLETMDGSLSGHWENTILITENGTEILTLP